MKKRTRECTKNSGNKSGQKMNLSYLVMNNANLNEYKSRVRRIL